MATQGTTDMKVLQNLETDLRPLHPIDTVKAVQIPLRLSQQIGLYHLLEVPNVAFAAFHAASNDAHFVLRALLMIAVSNADGQQPVSLSSTAVISALRAVAQAHRPITAV
jgi:hypothetical protein